MSDFDIIMGDTAEQAPVNVYWATSASGNNSNNNDQPEQAQGDDSAPRPVDGALVNPASDMDRLLPLQPIMPAWTPTPRLPTLPGPSLGRSAAWFTEQPPAPGQASRPDVRIHMPPLPPSSAEAGPQPRVLSSPVFAEPPVPARSPVPGLTAVAGQPPAPELQEAAEITSQSPGRRNTRPKKGRRPSVEARFHQGQKETEQHNLTASLEYLHQFNDHAEQCQQYLSSSRDDSSRFQDILDNKKKKLGELLDALGALLEDLSEEQHGRLRNFRDGLTAFLETIDTFRTNLSGNQQSWDQFRQHLAQVQQHLAGLEAWARHDTTLRQQSDTRITFRANDAVTRSARLDNWAAHLDREFAQVDRETADLKKARAELDRQAAEVNSQRAVLSAEMAGASKARKQLQAESSATASAVNCLYNYATQVQRDRDGAIESWRLIKDLATEASQPVLGSGGARELALQATQALERLTDPVPGSIAGLFAPGNNDGAAAGMGVSTGAMPPPASVLMFGAAPAAPAAAAAAAAYGHRHIAPTPMLAPARRLTQAAPAPAPPAASLVYAHAHMTAAGSSRPPARANISVSARQPLPTARPPDPRGSGSNKENERGV
ncbi:hypothetical protein B0H66DRAFT_604207 [Apodospora peruviana]|uniref:Uncharacterized protein n=1 Tax=Apodospora peruviana TaxID=516989 RepID=A0AAE0I090_9PEZI|nr:hypothetical protein B0H66DRAFT_604207 [Apodospora peruviana]